jgi:hypothetical protein
MDEWRACDRREAANICAFISAWSAALPLTTSHVAWSVKASTTYALTGRDWPNRQHRRTA